ncbi:MAG: DUF2752 domain-containing protein [Acidobacteriota bacterium]|nr:DUF2752 domain-containing protein [Acidobacteriota bacterium]
MTRWLRLVSAILVVVIGGWVLYTFPPVTTAFYPQCVFKQASGLDCPGCGTTRALHALLHGRFGEALRLNAMLFALMIAGGFAVPGILRGETPRFLYTRWFGWGSFVVVTGWWVVRNIWWRNQ